MSRIMIIDDDKNLSKLYCQELSDDGYKVEPIRNGQEALRSVRRKRPDIIILDVCLPGMDGLDILGRVLAIDKTIPIIINTAYSNYKDNFMTWSADAYIMKSGDLTELKEKIAELLAEAEEKEQKAKTPAGNLPQNRQIASSPSA